MKYLAVLCFTFFQLQAIAQDPTGKKIKIQWVDSLENIPYSKDFTASFYKIIDTNYQAQNIYMTVLSSDASPMVAFYGKLKYDFHHDSLNYTLTVFFKKYKNYPKFGYSSITLYAFNADNSRVEIPCVSGIIKIDKKEWDMDMLKAELEFEFKNKVNKSKPIYWKAKIYTEKISSIIECF